MNSSNLFGVNKASFIKAIKHATYILIGSMVVFAILYFIFLRDLGDQVIPAFIMI